MRKTTGFFLILATAFVFLAAGQAQQKVVSFKKLQEFLPKIDLAGFTRLKPGGETSSALGMSMSEAHVIYEKGSGDNLITIEVKISDTAGVPFGQMGASIIGMMEFENETETGYEKSVKVQGFPGTEKVDNFEDGRSAEILLFVGNRFSVELRGSGTSEAELLHKLLNDMKLGELAKLTQ
ncbi:MAG: hypothetical protein FJY81_04895 [Candidatus Aminicenantes bacterium]|nr:hypothetical protein [Candidatus Aminicenantes bacterium]